MSVGRRVRAVQADRAAYQRLQGRRQFQAGYVRRQACVRAAEQRADAAFSVGEGGDGDDAQAAVDRAQPTAALWMSGSGAFNTTSGLGRREYLS